MNGLSGLNKEHVQAILNILHAETSSSERMTGKNCNFEWILDTGASQHVTGEQSHLIEVTPIHSCSVGLPDGRTTHATMKGRVKISEFITLDHVLYVSGLDCHLISVSQLVDQSNCIVTFTDSIYAIQDLHSRNLIEAGERRDGLFYFRGFSALHAITVGCLPDYEMWHRHLEHPSDRVLKLLPAIRTSSTPKKLNRVCEVCPQAKQVHDPYPLSENKASNVFDLMGALQNTFHMSCCVFSDTC
ncbi:unnamed protein product [Cuscuta europaea]|uniref:GAG-pre-integrase domain-containing protein n=1 Tax=Cuscuta europaea TaxID=41803 RepID=A0A9P1EFG3_CUSEU|nr:unnamed protein product [Cuscuta europaea]